jgi:L-ascorbate metabolism protein UlaG (beta-lactamase superfamily)
MKRFLLTLAIAGALGSGAHALPNPTEVIPAKGGAIRITPIYHGSLQIEYKGKVIHVDPFSAGDYTGAKKADYILITHTHADHLDLKAISKLTGGDSVQIFAPKSAMAKLKTIRGSSVEGFDNYAHIELSRMAGLDEIKKFGTIDVYPAYNVVRGPKPGQKYHPKGEFNGYVLELGGKSIYIAGDTEATPEMKALKNIDIAFLPMNLPYTMTPQEAAAGAKAFKPKVVYPYHYRYPFTKANNNPQQFAKALEGSDITVRLRNWYGHPAK